MNCELYSELQLFHWRVVSWLIDLHLYFPYSLDNGAAVWMYSNQTQRHTLVTVVLFVKGEEEGCFVSLVKSQGRDYREGNEELKMLGRDSVVVFLMPAGPAQHRLCFQAY